MVISSEQNVYYYLISGLPDISFGKLPEYMQVKNVLSQIEEELSPGDMNKLNLLYLKYDNRHLINICKKIKGKNEAFAKYSFEELTERLNTSDPDLPIYMHDYYTKYADKIQDEDERYENELSSLYFDYVMENSSGILRQWFQFENHLNNLLTALQCRNLNESIEKHVVGKDDIVYRLMTSSSPDFGLGMEFPFLDQIIKFRNNHEFAELERFIDYTKWEKLEELSAFSYFTFDFVAVYILKVMIAYRWTLLDEVKGQKLLDRKIDNLRKNIKTDSVLWAS